MSTSRVDIDDGGDEKRRVITAYRRRHDDSREDFDARVWRLCLGGDWKRRRRRERPQVVLVGERGVGKTLLRERWRRGGDDGKGAGCSTEKFLVIGCPFDFHLVELSTSLRDVIAEADLVIAAFDMSRVDTIGVAHRYLRESRDRDERTSRLMVGLKSELVEGDLRRLVRDEAAAVARETEAELWCCSSLSGEQVEELLERVACLLFEREALRLYESRAAAGGSNLPQVFSCFRPFHQR